MDAPLEKIKSIIAEMIECQPVDIGDTDTFLSLGMDSLDLTELVIGCEQDLHVEIFNEIFDAFPLTVLSVDTLHQTILRAQGLAA